MAIYGGIEAGGTKWVCAVGSGPDEIQTEERFLTTTPEETIARAIAFFQQQRGLAAIGIGSFGPVDLHLGSPTFGFITTTPKPGWQQIDVAGRIGQALGLPVGFDLDVNAAMLGEQRWGAAVGLKHCVYFTIGTGIGAGCMINTTLQHGLLHPELGHIRLPHNLQSDPFPGVCPYHGDCLEGLASGPALERRWGQRAETLATDHPCWALEAHYLALALVNVICAISPQRIIMGGGVMMQPQLFPLLRRNVQELLNGYLQIPAILEQIDDYIVPPGLGDRSGILGALALAQQAAQ